MNRDGYVKIYMQLLSRIGELKGRRAELEAALGDTVHEIENIKKAIDHLAPLAGMMYDEKDVSNMGITDAVRHVLDPKERLSVAEIKAKMEEQGFDFSSYNAPNASIHTILKRLVDAGKAELEKDGWNSFYKYLPTDEDIPF